MLRIEAIGPMAEVGGGIGSFSRSSTGEIVPGPVSPGLVALTVDRLVYEGQAPVDLPGGPGLRLALRHPRTVASQSDGADV